MTTLFLARSGGHLRQLVELSPRIPCDGPAVWVTNFDDQSRSLMEDRIAHYVRNVRPRDVLAAVASVPDAHRLWQRYRFRRAISTGSGIALAYLPYLAARGVHCHYIESATRVSGPSLTGHLIGRIPAIRCYTQYKRWAGRRWRFAGNVFDGYAARSASPGSSSPLRVVVTLGIATGFPFHRLVQRLVPLLVKDGPLSTASGRDVSVLWQTEGTPVDDLRIEATPSLPAAELARALRAADVVISHAGTGSAIAAIENGRFPILVPREASHGEIGDDHQCQLAEELETRGLALIRTPAELDVDDMLAAQRVVVRRSASPPPFVLDT